MDWELFILIVTVTSIALPGCRTLTFYGDNQINGLRYRRGISESNCQQLSSRYYSCVKNMTWDLGTVFMNTSCNKTVETYNTRDSDCFYKEICQKPLCTFSWGDINENITCDSDPATWRKIILLKLLCFPQDEGQQCVKVLANAYLNAKNESQKFHHLNTTSGRCCIAPLINAYNSSGHVEELKPSSWKRHGFPVPKVCNKRILASSTISPSSYKDSERTTLPSKSSKVGQTTKTIPLSSARSHPSQIPTQGKDNSDVETSSKISSRLKASLVIASIIFVVVALIIGRFLYHRMQRRRRAKYEDYGYSQLKIILDDDLYEDEEDDDDQLISAT